MRLAALLLGTFLFVTPALAQSADNTTSNPEAGKAPPKAHRVWDNESIQQIQGGINVVGDSPTNNPGKPPDPKAPVRPKIPGVFFKGT
ncbi:MAG TPA: hypothetical protein VG897_00360, partial [Terriglobales bacterium]|nr:hypothetical protein [Terriglobales bacterium]